MTFAKRLICLAAMASTVLISDVCVGQHFGRRGCGCADAGNTNHARGARRYHPAPIYSASHRGRQAASIDAWNGQQSVAYSWHGGNNYWRYGMPTALVVPPTAVFQTEYNWGVAQTRSLPIYHQFGRDFAEAAPLEPGTFSNTPYWPSSTSQFGIYPVRGPW